MNDRENFLNNLKYGENIRQKLTAMKGSLSTAISKNKLRIASGLMAILSTITISGCSGYVDKSTTIQKNPSTTIDNSSKPLSDKDSILQDFKTRYIEQYNKANGTNLNPSAIELHMPVQSSLFKTFDNQYVTHGSLPDETKKVLSNYGSYSVVFDPIKDNIDVIQITRNEKPLETVASILGKTTSVLSGNDLDALPKQLKAKEGLNKKITLLEFYNLADITMDLYNSSDQNSINYHTAEYNAAILELEKIKADKDLEKD